MRKIPKVLFTPLRKPGITAFSFLTSVTREACVLGLIGFALLAIWRLHWHSYDAWIGSNASSSCVMLVFNFSSIDNIIPRRNKNFKQREMRISLRQLGIKTFRIKAKSNAARPSETTVVVLETRYSKLAADSVCQICRNNSITMKSENKNLSFSTQWR